MQYKVFFFKQKSADEMRISDWSSDVCSSDRPTLCVARARDHAKRLMASRDPQAGGARGWLGGLPVAIKDLTDVAGVRTTYGSPIYADHVPETSHPLVTGLERNGGVVLAKSNTPEVGAGGSPFHEVFGSPRKQIGRTH